MARRPSVALWGQGGPAAAQAAACAALGWKVEVLVGHAPTSEASAAQVATATISPDELALRPDIDLVIMTDRPGTVTGGDLPGAPAIGAVLDSGHHLVLAPPLADTLVEADAIVEAVRSAASSGFTMLYGDPVCAAPVVEELLARLPGLGATATHISSKSVQPAPEAPAPRPSPLLSHGVHGIAAVLLSARLTGRGKPTMVAGARSGRDDDVTDAVMHFAQGDPVRVHSSFGPPSGPSWDLQVASPDQVLRVDLFPTPTLEHNGERIPVQTAGIDDPATAFGFVPQLQRFWADVAGGRAPVLQAAFGREVLEVVCAAHAAAGSAPVGLPFTGTRDAAPAELESGG